MISLKETVDGDRNGRIEGHEEGVEKRRSKEDRRRRRRHILWFPTPFLNILKRLFRSFLMPNIKSFLIKPYITTHQS
jgi:hypothetical protein